MDTKAQTIVESVVERYTHASYIWWFNFVSLCWMCAIDSCIAGAHGNSFGWNLLRRFVQTIRAVSEDVRGVLHSAREHSQPGQPHRGQERQVQQSAACEFLVKTRWTSFSEKMYTFLLFSKCNDDVYLKDHFFTNLVTCNNFFFAFINIGCWPIIFKQQKRTLNI